MRLPCKHFPRGKTQPLFHQEHRPTALDLARDLAMQVRGHAGDAARENFTTLGDKFLEEIRVFVVDRLDGNINAAAGHRAIGAAKSGTTFGSFRFHLFRFAVQSVPL